MNETPCACMQEPQRFDHYRHVHRLGVDTTNGRFGDVDLLRCTACGRHWLRYQVEYESFTASGRCFMGLITPEAAATLRPEAAVAFLEALDWHLYSGSYFGRKGRTTGRINADL